MTNIERWEVSVITVSDRDLKILDAFFVDTFNRILYLEEQWIKHAGLDDLTISEMHMLVAIGDRENKSMSSVAEQASLTNGTVTTMVKKLERKGYVARRQDEADKRVVRVGLSDSGRQVLSLHQAFHDDMVTHIMGGLEAHERETFLQMIDRLNIYFADLAKKEKAHDR